MLFSFGVNDGSAKCVFVYREVNSYLFSVLCVARISSSLPREYSNKRVRDDGVVQYSK